MGTVWDVLVFFVAIVMPMSFMCFCTSVVLVLVPETLYYNPK